MVAGAWRKAENGSRALQTPRSYVTWCIGQARDRPRATRASVGVLRCRTQSTTTAGSTLRGD